MKQRDDFDSLVIEFNSWLEEQGRLMCRLRNIARGMLSLGPSPHPVYDNPMLTWRQKDAVALGSDIKRTTSAIERERRLHSDEWYREAKKTQQQLYDLQKGAFNSERTS